MTKQIEAVYEEGRLRPLEPLGLPEGARLSIIVVTHGSSGTRRTPAEIISEIAALPMEALHMEAKELDGLDFEGRRKVTFSHLMSKGEFTDNLNSHVQLFKAKLDELLGVGCLLDEARQRAAQEANKLCPLSKDEEKIMGTTILRQIVEKYHCTTVEELEKKYQELRQQIYEVEKALQSCLNKNDQRGFSQFVSVKDDLAAQASEIEDAIGGR